MSVLNDYRDITVADFEFTVSPGGRPQPLCCVARHLQSGQLDRLWLDGKPSQEPPYATGPDTLCVLYYASADLGCHLAQHWPFPERVLDLYAEFRCQTAGRSVPCGHGLPGALVYYGLPALDVSVKDESRRLAMRGGSYTAFEQATLLDYCQTDVDATAKLLAAMAEDIDVPRALLRGRYTTAVTRMESTGVPIDVEVLKRLHRYWDRIKQDLVQRIDADYGVFEGTRFVAERWAEYLNRRNIPWPRLKSEHLALDNDTFREMARRYPAEVGPIRDLRHALSQLRLQDLAVGPDGRNRCLLSPFASKTGRNQPSNSKFIFGPSCWLRSLIKPGPGRAVGYADWKQQEFGIAAALSGDTAMMTAYQSGDPYLAFAKQAGAAPADATRQTHRAVREHFKLCALAVQYGMGPASLAQQLGTTPCHARELLDLHRRTYPRYWEWSDGVADTALLTNQLQTVFGWTVHVGQNANPRSLRNFPMQANGAEMMRLAACLATERGIGVCCPVHDAFLIEADVDVIEAEVERMQECMREASEIVLAGFSLSTDATVVRYPDRYIDERGRRMWDTVMGLLDREERQ